MMQLGFFCARRNVAMWPRTCWNMAFWPDQAGWETQVYLILAMLFRSHGRRETVSLFFLLVLEQAIKHSEYEATLCICGGTTQAVASKASLVLPVKKFKFSSKGPHPQG